MMNETKAPDLSISIVNWNNRYFLKNCIQSILDTVRKTKYELIVVDNGSIDRSAEMVRSLFPQVNLITNKENKFFSGGNNQAIQRGKGKYVLILNEDLIVRDSAIDNKVDLMEKTPEAAAIGAKLLNPNGTLQQLYSRFPTIWRAVFFNFNDIPFFRRFFQEGSYLWKKFRVHYLTENLIGQGPFKVDQPPATCVMLRRSVIDKVGGMDTDYGLLWDDVDWCYRMKREGKFYYLPTAEVVHYHGVSQKKHGSKKRKDDYYSGAVRFFRKNHSKFQLYLFKFLVCLMNFLERVTRVIVSIIK